MTKDLYLIRSVMFIAGALVGLLFKNLGIPLPWVLGPMLSTTILKLKYPAAVSLPRSIRDLFMIPLGYSIGVHVTPEACLSIASHISSIFLVTACIIVFCVLLALWTTRATGISYASSVIGNMPGGLAPMILVCDKIPRADIGMVAVLQSVRLMMVIAAVPIILVYGGFGTPDVLNQRALPEISAALPFPVWLLVLAAVSGAFIFAKLNVTAAFFIGPIASIALISLYTGVRLPEAPVWLVNVAQVFTGIYLGTYIDPVQLKRNRRLLPVCVIGAVLIVLASMVIGYIASKTLNISLATAFLACAPGGVAEMCIIGMALGEDVPLILAYQLFRMLFVSFVMPCGLKWFFNRHAPTQ